MAFSMAIDGSGLGLGLALEPSQAIRLSELYVQSLADLFEAIDIVVIIIIIEVQSQSQSQP